MRISLRSVIVLTCLSLFATGLKAQETDIENDETYCKANIAFTDFSLLGVNRTHYARCVKEINFVDPSKVGKRLLMDGVEFVDDGTDYDVKANDGILTSKTLFTYNEGQSTLLPGQMTLVKNNSVIYTNEFLHSDKVNNSGSVAKIKITCTFSWIKCSSWPSNIQSLCYSTSWPFSGYFEIKECSITYED